MRVLSSVAGVGSPDIRCTPTNTTLKPKPNRTTAASLSCPPGVPEELTGAEPQRFFEPTPSASGTFAGWLGVFLDTSRPYKVDWGEIAAIIKDAVPEVAPKKLIAQLDGE